MLHVDARAEELAVARMAVFGLWFVLVATTPVTQYAHLPPQAITPVGVMGYLPLEALLASPSALLMLKAAALLGCLLCIVGVRPYPLVAIGTMLTLLVLDGAMKSTGGFVNHAQFAPLYAAMIVALFPAADAFTPMQRREPRDAWLYRTPLLLVALTITVAYSFIGCRRLFVGGFDLFLGESVTVWMVARSLQYAAYDFDVGLIAADSPIWAGALAVGMFVTTLLEILSPAAIRCHRFRLLWLAGIVPFHVATLITMNIFFWENLILIGLFMTPSLLGP